MRSPGVRVAPGLLALLTLLASSAGCSRNGPFSLRDQLRAKGGWAMVSSAHQRRWGSTDAGARRVVVRVPAAGGTLRLSSFGPEGFRVRVGDPQPRLSTGPLPLGWSDLEVDLPGRLFGRSLTLELLDCGDAPCGWGDAVLAPKDAEPQKTNLLFVLVDTLRADALGSYGGDNATPNVDAVARGGVVFERTIAQAPWTLPSVASLLSGAYPAISPGWGTPGQGPNPEVATLAEIVAANGYATGAFVANPVVADRVGFGRGFDAYWLSPPEAGVMTPAEKPVALASGWIRTHRSAPWFAYVHLMDPHDPYQPPSRRGAPGIGNPDPAFTGAAPMPDAETVREWRALYDEEVRGVDRQIGALLASLAGSDRAHTLVVITADHGEEFMEHGFLKHGATLFDAALHVPLILSGPGVRPGGRVRELSRLVDVVPTLAALLKLKVAAPVERRWSGVSLAATVGSGAPMPRLSAISETFAYGPLRWCIDDGSRKVFFFNRGHRLPSERPALAFPLHWIETHLPVEAVYRTTGEHPVDVLMAPPDPQVLRWGRREANDYVRGKVGGAWMSLRGDGSGGRLRGTLTSGGEDARFVPFFWAPDDRVSHHGRLFEIDVADDGAERLAVLLGRERQRIAQVSEVTPGLPVGRQQPGPGGPGFFCWEQDEPRRAGAEPADTAELIARLRALGYIQ